MAHLGFTTNQYGTRVSQHRCDTCAQEFTVCPAIENEASFPHCLAPECDSYDATRDVDLLFDSNVIPLFDLMDQHGNRIRPKKSL